MEWRHQGRRAGGGHPCHRGSTHRQSPQAISSTSSLRNDFGDCWWMIPLHHPWPAACALSFTDSLAPPACPHPPVTVRLTERTSWSEHGKGAHRYGSMPSSVLVPLRLAVSEWRSSLPPCFLALATPHPRLAIPHLCLAISHPCLAIPHLCLAISHPCLTIPHPCLAIPHSCLTTPHPCLAILHSCLAIPHSCLSNRHMHP
eukprot:362772-Chlamydomonas_euryale.AAC.1